MVRAEITARVWAAQTYALVALFIMFAGWYGYTLRNPPLFATALIGGLVYEVLVIVTQGYTVNAKYAEFLAEKARKESRWKSWWFSKFAYWLPHYVGRQLPRDTRDVHVGIEAGRASHLEDATDLGGALPDFRSLRRALRVKTERIFLFAGRDRAGQIDSQIERLRRSLEKGHNKLDGYVRYMVGNYLSFTPEERALIGPPGRVGALDRIQRNPLLSRLVEVVVLVVLSVLIYLVLGVKVVVPP